MDDVLTATSVTAGEMVVAETPTLGWRTRSTDKSQSTNQKAKNKAQNLWGIHLQISAPSGPLLSVSPQHIKAPHLLAPIPHPTTGWGPCAQTTSPWGEHFGFQSQQQSLPLSQSLHLQLIFAALSHQHLTLVH